MGLLPASGPAAPPSPPPQHIHWQPDSATDDDDARRPPASPRAAGRHKLSDHDQRADAESWAPPTPGPPSDSSRSERAAESDAAADRASEGLRRNPAGGKANPAPCPQREPVDGHSLPDRRQHHFPSRICVVEELQATPVYQDSLTATLTATEAHTSTPGQPKVPIRLMSRLPQIPATHERHRSPLAHQTMPY